jgi:hypothetical protein
MDHARFPIATTNQHAIKPLRLLEKFIYKIIKEKVQEDIQRSSKEVQEEIQ